MFLAQKLSVTGILSRAACLLVGKSEAAGMQIAEFIREASTEGGGPPEQSPEDTSFQKTSALSWPFCSQVWVSFRKAKQGSCG